MKVISYFFATPLINYTKLIEQQANTLFPDIKNVYLKHKR